MMVAMPSIQTYDYLQYDERHCFFYQQALSRPLFLLELSKAQLA